MLQAAAPSCGEPRPISRVGRIHAGRPHRPCFRHTTHTYRRYGLRTLRDCAALCRTCAHCVYISFNLASNDCSWFRHCALVRVILTLALTPTLTLALTLTRYRHCDLDELQGRQGGYSSMRVREP